MILPIIYFIVLAMIIAFVYKMLVGLISMIVGGALIFILSGFKFSFNKIELFANKHPKLFISYGVLLNAIIAFIYYAIIGSTSIYFLLNYNINSWIIFALAVLWCMSLINRAESFHNVLMSCCLFPFIAFWFFGGFIAIVVWIFLVIYFISKNAGIVEGIKMVE